MIPPCGVDVAETILGKWLGQLVRMRQPWPTASDLACFIAGHLREAFGQEGEQLEKEASHQDDLREKLLSQRAFCARGFRHLILVQSWSTSIRMDLGYASLDQCADITGHPGSR